MFAVEYGLPPPHYYYQYYDCMAAHCDNTEGGSKQVSSCYVTEHCPKEKCLNIVGARFGDKDVFTR